MIHKLYNSRDKYKNLVKISRKRWGFIKIIPDFQDNTPLLYSHTGYFLLLYLSKIMENKIYG